MEEQHQQQQQRQFSPEVVEQRSFPREEDLSGASSQQPSEPSLEQPTSSAPAVEAVYSLHAHSAARAAIEDEVEIDEDIQEDLAGEVEERMEEIFGLEKEEEF